MPNVIFNRMALAERDAKLRKLAELEGFDDPMELVRHAIFDGISPGICVICGATAEVEPDQDRGRCENCREGFIVAAPVLAGII